MAVIRLQVSIYNISFTSKMISVSSRDSQQAPHGALMAELCMAIGGLAIGIGEFTPMTTLPSIAKGMSASLPQTGHIVSAYALGVVVGAPLITVFLARVVRRSMLIGLMITFALANILSACSSNLAFLVAARFVSGLPHGAFFGIAALVAASLARPDQRGQAIARVMLGLTVANIIGVPLATAVSDAFGWRATFLLIAALALCSTAGCWLSLRPVHVAAASPRSELRVLRQMNVWLTLSVIGIGFGGLFALYTYITPALTFITRLSSAIQPFYLSLLGIGMTLGSLIGGRLADRSPVKTIYGVLAWNAVVLPLFALTAHESIACAVNLIAMGAGIAVVPAVQTRLMDIAGDAQTISAALLHAAFNVANAIGAWAGGLVVGAGLGIEATGFVGTICSACGAGILFVSLLRDRRLS